MVIFLIAAVVLAGVGILVVWPLIFDRLEPYQLAGMPDESFSERDSLLEALSELEQSFLSGKISETDYSSQKKVLQKRYIQVVGTDTPAVEKPVSQASF